MATKGKTASHPMQEAPRNYQTSQDNSEHKGKESFSGLDIQDAGLLYFCIELS